MKRFLTTLLLFALVPANGFAWGYVGHSMISRLAMENLPSSMPAFMRSPQAVDEITYMGPEEDRIKGAGQSWDEDNDEGHFLDIDDNHKIGGVIALDALPKDMAAYADALSKAGTTPYKMGFVPYTIMDGFERARMDFALWRVADYLATHAETPEKRAEQARERDLREALTLRDIGDWGHFVGDGSQPLHITIHYNGWGDYPNPKGYTTNHIHSLFETQTVDKYSKIEDVRKMMLAPSIPAADHLLTQEEIGKMTGAYLGASADEVAPLYDLYAAGGFTNGSKEAIDFTDLQLARGASMLRDLITLAWENSDYAKVGYPALSVKDILDGKVAPNSSD